MRTSVFRLFDSGFRLESEFRFRRHAWSLILWLSIPFLFLGLSCVDGNRTVGVSVGGYRPSRSSLTSFRRFFQLGLEPGGIFIRRVDSLDPFLPKFGFFTEIYYGVSPDTPLDAESIDRIIETGAEFRLWASASPLLQPPISAGPWTLKIHFWFLGVAIVVLWFLLRLKHRLMNAPRSPSRDLIP